MDKRLLEKNIIVFDIGNVLVRFDSRYIAQMCLPPQSWERLYDAVFGSGLWHIIDTGLMSNGLLAKLMCEAANTTDITDYLAVSNLLENYPQYEHALTASTWLPELKKMGKKLYYLTNYGEPGLCHTLERFSFFEHFDGGVVSSHEFVCKPARRIFDILCQRYNFKPEEALFIDDTLENVEAAKALGFSTWHYLEGRSEPIER